MSRGYAIDLHTHSLRSDGALSPTDLVTRAAERGVTIQALSDHDTLSGVAEAAAVGQRLGVRIIPATELNTESGWGDVHVLAYFVDPNDAPFEERMKTLLQTLDLEKQAKQFPHQLSGGEMQRVAIARALAHNPRLVIADEPTGNLDSGNAEVVLGWLAKISREMGHTVLMATHSREAAAWASRVIEMRDGQLLSS